MARRPTLTSGLEALVRAIEDGGPFDAPRAKALLSEAELREDDLAPWADFDHPEGDSYGRKLVHDGGWFELMVMSWRDGSMSAIHDHGQAQGGAVRLFGDAEQATFRWRGAVLGTCSRSRVPAGTVVPVVHTLVHQMGNVGQPPFLTLHLYGCEGCTSGVTRGARVFDLDEGAVERTDGGVFFSLPDAAVTSREHGLSGDFPTTLRHNLEMLARLTRMARGARLPSALAARQARLARWLFDDRTAAWAAAELAGDHDDVDPTCARYQRSFEQEAQAAERILGWLREEGAIDGGRPPSFSSLSAGAPA